MLTLGENGRGMTPDQAAVQWLLRLRRGPLGAAERVEFQHWLSDQTNAATFKKLQMIWRGAGQLTNEPGTAKIRQRGAAPKWLSHRAAIGLAASVTLLIISGFVFRTHIHSPAQLAARTPAPTSSIASSVTGSETYATATGQRFTTTLRDGSVLTLNTNSLAKVAYSAGERAILLQRGQALFEVAKGQKRPFVVYAGEKRIVATGTAFDVRLGQASVEVTMVEGHVVIGQTGRSVSIHEGRILKLDAGQRLFAQFGKPPAVTIANIDRATSWISGKLIFVDARLSDAVDEANRYTEAPIRLGNNGLSDLRVNGVFRAGQSAEFARAVAQIYPLSVKYEPDGSIMIANRSSP